MSTINVSIELSNDAFADDGNYEVARILRELAHSVESWDGNADNWGTDASESRLGSLFDVNGNQVGKVTLTR